MDCFHFTNKGQNIVLMFSEGQKVFYQKISTYNMNPIIQVNIILSHNLFSSYSSQQIKKSSNLWRITLDKNQNIVESRNPLNV